MRAAVGLAAFAYPVAALALGAGDVFGVVAALTLDAGALAEPDAYGPAVQADRAGR